MPIRHIFIIIIIIVIIINFIKNVITKLWLEELKLGSLSVEKNPLLIVPHKQSDHNIIIIIIMIIHMIMIIIKIIIFICIKHNNNNINNNINNINNSINNINENNINKGSLSGWRGHQFQSFFLA